MKKIILLFILFIALGQRSILAAGMDNPASIYPQPVIKWGNSSYHDSLGARDPWVIKDNGTYYLYYDCIEDLLNPSFESNMGTNGWDMYEAQISTSTDEHLFGQQSLKIITSNKGTPGGPQFGAFTSNYYFQDIKDNAHLAVPTGLEVVPNTRYIASVYVKAHVASSIVGLTVVEYTDDPGFWSNHIEPITNKTSGYATGDWQKLSVPFTTLSNTKAITLSLVTNGNVTSYWDGVQLERVDVGQNTSSEFPQNIDFNRTFENTVGWRTCIATSTDEVNFQKRGPVEIQGQVEDWQNYIKPGYVGDDSNYLNVFPYSGKLYAYTWVNGYLVDPSNPDVLDKGQVNVRRFGYEDRRIFFSGGGSARSALVEGDSPLGPFRRIARGGPITHPTNEQQCQTGTQVGINQPWGCDYTASSGVPQQINNQWVLFLSGMGGINGSGTWNGWHNGACLGDGINSGIALSDNPFGPWTASSFSPIFTANDVCQNGTIVPEGPIYYYDRASDTYVLFTNQLFDGSITAFWTKNPLTNWPVNNRKVIINSSGNGQFTKLGPAYMNLPTVIEEGNKLIMYFGYRENHPVTNPPRWSIDNYLFHNIGRLTMDMPLFPSPTPTPTLTPTATPTSTPTSTPTPLPGDLNHDGRVDILDLRQRINSFTNIFDYNLVVGSFGK